MTSRREAIAAAMLVSIWPLLGQASAQAESRPVSGEWSGHLAATRAEALSFIREHPSEIPAYLHLIAARIMLRAS